MFRVKKGTKMTPDLLSKFITKHKVQIEDRYKKLKGAYENDYEIYHFEKKPDWKPDNRISVNFAKYIVDTMNGFFSGIPIKVTSEDESVLKYLEFLDKYNDQDNNNSELAKTCDIYGCGYEMYYVDENGEIGITYLTPMESFFIYDDSVLERPLFFVHHYTDADGVEWGSWSDETYVQHFVNKGSYKWVDEPKSHGFSGVPASEFLENEERIGIFESALPMINAYNKAISEKANDVDYFADAYLKILGEKLEEEDLTELRRNRIINFEGDIDNKLEIGFIQKPDGDSTQEHLIDRLERLIFQTCMVANISDENFGSSSGIALRYKLKCMSDLAKTKERKFTSGMNRRYKLIFSNPISKEHGVQKDDWVKINTHFTLNYPSNIADEAQTARNLEGIVSKETQLKTLSIVDNVQNEIDKIKSEDEESGFSDIDFGGGANV